MNIVSQVARTGGSAANAVWQMFIALVQALGRAPRKGTAAFYVAAVGRHETP